MGTNQQALIGICGLSTPVNSVAPVCYGSPLVGVALNCTTGTWSGSPTYTYQWKRSGSTNIGTNSSSYTLVVGDVGATISCVVTATNAAGANAQTSNSTVAVVTAGEQLYTAAGNVGLITDWICPAGVTSVTVLCVSPGGSQGGGSLAYKNNIAVTPGNTYVVSLTSMSATFISSGDVHAVSVSSPTMPNIAFVGTGGGRGGSYTGGGAGGYSGYGGDGPVLDYGGGYFLGTSGNGGGGGGGGYLAGVGCSGGGGVGLYGQGASGAAGTQYEVSGSYPGPGKGGSGGANGQGLTTVAYPGGGSYGGSPGMSADNTRGTSGLGAVRIIWPGNLRSFPSTNTGAL